jgi:lipopolysaccharide/colanic/teichoic acid biosynthesis glycosyltransferase
MSDRICMVVTTEATVRVFLAAHLKALQSDYDLTVVANASSAGLLREMGVRGTLIALPLERRIAPWADLTVLWRLYRLMRSGRFSIVQSMTPKAGLLAMLAAHAARVPVRIHMFTGQVWAARSGAARVLLKSIDRLVAKLATTTLADSASQRAFLIEEGVASPSAISVLANGSVSGVDSTRFKPDPTARQQIRQRLGIPMTDVLLLFVGRVTPDKGVLDLVAAFATIAGERRDAHLLLVGSDEACLRPRLAAACGRHSDRLQFLDFTERPEDVMAAADVLCLPSYREGFGCVVIEAAACGVPAVASRIYGIVDAVDDGKTGLLHTPGEVGELTAVLRRIASDAELRRTLGAAARSRAASDFAPERLTAALSSFCLEQLDRARSRGWYPAFGKRVFDVLVSALCMLLLSPVYGLLAVMVRITLGKPLLFRQRRPGLNGAPFTLVKFRSMNDRYDDRGGLLPDDERLSAFGRFLRASSLDELPELWNVLVGDMSLVGPRPLLMEYLGRYSVRQARRHAVKPGITGLAQVHGRNALPWAERFELDLHYVRSVSLWLDLTILFRTVWHVAARRGISQPGHSTAEEFKGHVAS